MRSFVLGCAIVAVAVAILVLVAIAPYMNKAKESALPIPTVVDRPPLPMTPVAETSPPPITTKPDTQSVTEPTGAVKTELDIEKVLRPAAASIANRPSPSRCDPDLAEDLAGQCRAKPCPTMGALEAPGASAAPNAKPACSAVPRTSKTSSSRSGDRKDKGRPAKKQTQKKDRVRRNK